ncbi:hypothetical protein D3C72_1894550 [compost metagenome]
MGIPEHHFDLGAAQRGQAAAGGKRYPLQLRVRIIDDIDGQLDRRLDFGACGRQGAGQGVDRPDTHGLLLRLGRHGAEQRQTRGDTRNELHLHY